MISGSVAVIKVIQMQVIFVGFCS